MKCTERNEIVDRFDMCIENNYFVFGLNEEELDALTTLMHL